MPKLCYSISFVFSMFFSVANAQLVMPGDYPDPSVTRIGDTYWATATTSNWAPVFPLLESKDLVHWETRTFVFDELPDWADYYFWAPEIEYDNGKVFVYYSAHKKGGNLCLGIASADKPEGPYTDHGPMMCQEVGSIDAFPVRDENGKLFLIWKEDGNSVGNPTPIWISEMKEDRTGLVGEKQELFRNDAAWEANLVEGVSILRHGEFFYAFYAAAGCCGSGCTYATGIARARKLLGPWEKYERNPVLTSDAKWMCPGHGTPVEKDGKFYFLYHAYDKETNVYTGRQGLLQEFSFSEDGWVRFHPLSNADVKHPHTVRDEFDGDALSSGWQWSVFRRPSYSIRGGRLELSPESEEKPGFLGHKTFSGNYRARTTVLLQPGNAAGGVALIGDDDNMITVTATDKKLTVGRLEKGVHTIISETQHRGTKMIHLEMSVSNGKDIKISSSADGKRFTPVSTGPIDGSFLPPWDRALRIGILSKGQKDRKAVFENFILYH